jgi:biopolymer transport protein ExbD
MRSSTASLHEGYFGFQIAPMIDVVFVIMLFFMVMAGTVKVEKEINTQLPGYINPPKPASLPDEIVISIAGDGQVALNVQDFDTPASGDLLQLKATLTRLKQSADAAKSPALVTIVSEPGAKYSRVVDVLDALALAKITNVTFAVNPPD